VDGDRLVIPLPLAGDFPEVPEVHYFAVRTVVGEQNRSEYSNQAVLVPRPPPAAPGGLVAEARGDGVALTWRGDGPEVVGYHVYRRGAAERVWGQPLSRVGRDRTDHLDDTASYGESYIYAVTSLVALDPLVESSIAETREVDYRDRFPPAVPAGLVALVEEGRVRLVWEVVPASDLAGYRVTRASGADEAEPLGDGLVTAAEWVDEEAAPDLTYTWRVQAVDEVGNVSAPAEVTATAR
jgi:hypothetical protein